MKRGVWWAVSTAAEKLSYPGDVSRLNVPENLGKSRGLTLNTELKKELKERKQKDI